MDISEDITFIYTERNRVSQQQGAINNIIKYYPDSHIIIAHQSDSLKFAKGQLYNIAFTFSKTPIVVFMDLDFRFLNYIPIRDVLSSSHPMMGYNKIIDGFERNDGRIVLNKEIRKGEACPGGCCVFTVDQFKKSNGFSNLCFNWGAEDSILLKRVGKYVRHDCVMCHLSHIGCVNKTDYGQNVLIWQTHSTRNPADDGMNQTVATIENYEVNSNVSHLKIKDIDVVPSYKYKRILDLRRKDLLAIGNINHG